MCISDPKEKFFTQIISTNGVVRSKSLLPELERQAIRFEITNGVVPTYEEFISEKYHSKRLTRLTTQRNISLGEVGCAQAHRNAAKNFLLAKQPFGVIFEDDAEITGEFDFSEVSNFLDSQSPRLVFFGWLPGYAVTATEFESTQLSIIELITPPTCAFAYGLNKPAAKLLVGCGKTIIDLADWPIQILNKTTFGALKRHIVTAPQEPNLSLIGKRVEDSKNLLTNLTGKFLIILSIIFLMLYSKSSGLNLTWRQIIHRIVLKDFIYSVGKKAILDGNWNSDIVLIPRNLYSVIKFFVR